MGNLNRPKGKEGAPSGPRPPKEKPKTRPEPITPVTPEPEEVRFAPPLTREKALEVTACAQANADEACRELDATLKAHTEGFEPDEAQRGIDGRTKSRSESRERGFYFGGHTVKNVYRRTSILKKAGKKRNEIQKAVVSDCHHEFRMAQVQVYTVITGKKVRLIDPKTDELLRQLDKAVPDNYADQSRPERLRIIEQITPQLGIQAAPEVVDAAFLDLKNVEDHTSITVDTVNDKKGFDEIWKQSDTADPEQAFLEAIKQSSQKVRARYQEYLETWQAESVSAIFTPLEINGVPVESLSEVALQNAKQIIKTGTGITLNMEEGNYGTIEFGDFFGGCALHSVNGEPKLFIYDRNADRGVRGPIDPAEIRSELAHALIDDYFSEQFRQLVPQGSEVDPQKIADAKLFKIVHAFLPPGSDEHMDTLNALQRRIMRNLAILFATPNPNSEYISLEDKARFLNNLKPDRLAIAKIKLQERDFPEKFSLSEFASSLTPS